MPKFNKPNKPGEASTQQPSSSPSGTNPVPQASASPSPSNTPPTGSAPEALLYIETKEGLFKVYIPRDTVDAYLGNLPTRGFKHNDLWYPPNAIEKVRIF